MGRERIYQLGTTDLTGDEFLIVDKPGWCSAKKIRISDLCAFCETEPPAEPAGELCSTWVGTPDAGTLCGTFQSIPNPGSLCGSFASTPTPGSLCGSFAQVPGLGTLCGSFAQVPSPGTLCGSFSDSGGGGGGGGDCSDCPSFPDPICVNAGAFPDDGGCHCSVWGGTWHITKVSACVWEMENQNTFDCGSPGPAWNWTVEFNNSTPGWLVTLHTETVPQISYANTSPGCDLPVTLTLSAGAGPTCNNAAFGGGNPDYHLPNTITISACGTTFGLETGGTILTETGGTILLE